MIKFPLLAASALVLGTVLAAPAHAQPTPTPSPTPPPGATGVCNDGTYCYNHDRSRACLRRGGVRQWFGSAAGQSNIGPDMDIILPDEGTERAYDLVRQAIALIVDTPADVDAITDKSDALSAKDQSQVQIALVQRAKDALARGNLQELEAEIAHIRRELDELRQTNTTQS